MKPRTIAIIGSAGRVLLTGTVLILISCTNNNAIAQKNDGRTEKTTSAPSTDIHTAVMSGNLEVVKQHIQSGTDINKKEPFGGSSPLITACLYEKKEVAQYLIESGANINFTNNDGSTALHVAAFFCKPELVKLLLEKKANKNIRNNYGSTAYESVAAPFNVVKGIYEQMKVMLEPMGVKMDLAYIEKTRPVIASLLK